MVENSMDDPNLPKRIAQLREELTQLRQTFQSVVNVMRDPAVKQYSEEQKRLIDTIKAAKSQLTEFGKGAFKDLSASFRAAIRDGDGFSGVLEKLKTRLEDFVFDMGVANPIVNGLFGENNPTLGSFFAKSPETNQSLFGGLFSGLFGGGQQQAGYGAPTIITNISTPDAGSFRAGQGQILASFYRQLSRATRFV